MPAKRRREHFGAGALSLDPATSVFLNCPFDLEYLHLFDAAVLATICCGFTPRSALESGTVAEPRMARITRGIFESKYSIHDLTRCTGEGDANLARFNVPLELGIAIAHRYLARRVADRHDWLVMVPTGHQYGRFISDLARIRSCNSQRHRPRLDSRCHDMVGDQNRRDRYAFSPTSTQGSSSVQARTADPTKNLGALAPMGRRGPRRAQDRKTTRAITSRPP